MQSYKCIIIDDLNSVVCQRQPEQVDKLIEHVYRDSFQTVVSHGQYFYSCLARKSFSVEGHQPIVLEVQSRQGARIPHHDVFQFREPVVPHVKVL